MALGVIGCLAPIEHSVIWCLAPNDREDIQEGFENIPATRTRLFTGANVGKQLLKLN